MTIQKEVLNYLNGLTFKEYYRIIDYVDRHIEIIPNIYEDIEHLAYRLIEEDSTAQTIEDISKVIKIFNQIEPYSGLDTFFLFQQRNQRNKTC